MSKGERIERFVEGLAGGSLTQSVAVAQNPFYRGFFQCWNAQQYYEAHDVLEHLWLRTNSADANFFKGLIQSAGAFVHLKKHWEHPTHPKHGRRLAPAVRLLRLATTNLAPFEPITHSLAITDFRLLLDDHADRIVASDYALNPWSPAEAPVISLLDDNTNRFSA